MHPISFESIGTSWKIEFEGSVPKEKIENSIFKFLEDFSKVYSRFRADSLVSLISENAGEFLFPESIKTLFPLYEKLYKLTDGKFTPLIGSLMNDTGYDANYSFKERAARKIDKLSDVIQYEKQKITTKKALDMDFGAMGKGYAIDEMTRLLKKLSIKEFVIDGGGDIFIQTSKKIRIGLENPHNTSEVIGIVELSSGSLCASSGNRRKWGKFHHIMDPDSLSSVNNVLAAWAIAENATVADALATALFLTNPDKLMNEFDFNYLVLYPDLSVNISKEFPGEIFYNKNND